MDAQQPSIISDRTNDINFSQQAQSCNYSLTVPAVGAHSSGQYAYDLKITLDKYSAGEVVPGVPFLYLLHRDYTGDGYRP